MKDALAVILAVAVAIVVLSGLGWVVQGNNFFLYRYFAPQFEQVRRETFEESKAYRQGMVQELQNMQFDYVKAEPEHKAALASIILHRAADVDENVLPAELRQFIAELKRQQ